MELARQTKPLLLLGRDRLAQHLAEARRPVGDARFELAVRVLDRFLGGVESPAHRLEAFRELAHLVLRTHLDRARKVAGGHPLGSPHQLFGRLDDAPGRDPGDEQSEQEAETDREEQLVSELEREGQGDVDRLLEDNVEGTRAERDGGHDMGLVTLAVGRLVNERGSASRGDQTLDRGEMRARLARVFVRPDPEQGDPVGSHDLEVVGLRRGHRCEPGRLLSGRLAVIGRHVWLGATERNGVDDHHRATTGGRLLHPDGHHREREGSGDRTCRREDADAARQLSDELGAD